MNVFITGGTGFIGRALVLRLRRDGETVTVLTRDPDRARSVLGSEAELLDADSGDGLIREALGRSSAVVNLAGEPLIGARWTDEKKRRLRSSRIDLTDSLVQHLRASSTKPEVLVSTSAVGFYGNRGDLELTEQSTRGQGFLAKLCEEWEEAAMNASELGIRVVTPRLGVVLGREEGALAKMLPAFRSGAGGPLGSGKQFVPWIHLDDLLDLLVAMIRDDRYKGAVNATGPAPVRFGDLAKALGKELSRPAVLPVPSLAIKALFGEAAFVLLDSQRVIPELATELGYKFIYPTVEAALTDLLETSSATINAIDGQLPSSAYLEERPPSFLLSSEEVVDRPLPEVFAFFSRAENLGLITPPGMNFRITSKPSSMEEGAEISYRLRIGPMPIAWTTRIDVWEDGVRFVDSQLKGPYSSWWHEHRFEAMGESTKMTDRVFYAPPAGPLGKIANHLFIADQLRRVFGYRASVMRRRFG